MTNYNERFDEILTRFADGEYSKHWVDERKTYTKLEAKQALTSLYKELVAEAKPEVNCIEHYKEIEQHLDQFEQNLLKQLEEN